RPDRDRSADILRPRIRRPAGTACRAVHQLCRRPQRALSRSAGDCPEFALLLRCCQWNFAERPDERPELSGTLDWPHFVELARFHRVQGLAWNALAQGTAPPDAAEALSA